jgi:predicted acylesterase/phospholipase RssA
MRPDDDDLAHGRLAARKGTSRPVRDRYRIDAMNLQDPLLPRTASGGRPNRKPVNIALQGGGAHGAFAWGVLDRILEDERLEIEAISATSAGAMNAVVLAYGAALDGTAGARGKLEEFWTEISRAGELYSPVRTMPWEKWLRLMSAMARIARAAPATMRRRQYANSAGMASR